MLATPGLSAGSALAPPAKEKSSATMGTVARPHEPRLDAARARGSPGSCSPRRPAPRGSRAKAAAKAVRAKHVHDFFSSRAVLDADSPVTEWRLSRIAPRGIAHLLGRDGLEPLGARQHVLDARSRGDRRAVHAGERGLVVLRIHIVGNHAALGALDLLGGRALVEQLGDRLVHRRLDLLERRSGGGRARRRHKRAASSDVPGYQEPTLVATLLVLHAAPDRGGCCEPPPSMCASTSSASLLAGLRGRVRGNEVGALQARLRHAQVREGDAALGDLRRLLRPLARPASTALARDLAVVCSASALHLVRRSTSPATTSTAFSGA